MNLSPADQQNVGENISSLIKSSLLKWSKLDFPLQFWVYFDCNDTFKLPEELKLLSEIILICAITIEWDKNKGGVFSG